MTNLINTLDYTPRVRLSELTSGYTLKPSTNSKAAEKKSVVEELTSRELLYLYDVINRPATSTTERNQVMFFGASTGNTIKLKLIEKSLVREWILSRESKGAPRRILEATPEAFAFLGVELQKYPGQGSYFHRWLQRRIKQYYEHRSVTVSIEYNLHGKRADVGYQTDSGVIAVEVELSAAGAVENVRKDLEAGFVKVEIFTPDKKMQEQIRQHLEYEGIIEGPISFQVFDVVI